MRLETSKIINEINSLNDLISTSINEGDFGNAINYDGIRQCHIDTLNERKFDLTEKDINGLERILKTITSEIKSLEHSMLRLKSQTNKRVKTLEGYK